jgi:hypothetical protein
MTKAQNSKEGYCEILGWREKQEADCERLFQPKLKNLEVNGEPFKRFWQEDDMIRFSFRKIILAMK